MVVSTLLLLSLGLLTAQAQECSKPVGGPNMDLSDNDIVLQTFPDGHRASFRCNIGHFRTGGSQFITCTAGSWSPVQLICERKNCGPAGPPLNGQTDYPNGTLFGDKAVFTCNEGYILFGKREITCGDKGWLDRIPLCEVSKCDPPAEIADGTFDPNKDSYEYSEVVQYSCRNDYTLNGSKSLACSEDGKFAPNPPTCTRVECSEPKIDNGMWKEGARPPYRYKNAVTLQCNPGYSMKGASIQTCEINSQWVPGLPQCTPVECEDPKIKNGDRKEGSQPPYRYSSTVTLQCSSGYIMNGASTQKCDINGQWSPGLPECQLVECEDPKIENGDLMEGSQPPYRHLSKVTLQCKSGYILEGASNQTCDRNGQWSPGLPECKLQPSFPECKDPIIKFGDWKKSSQTPLRYPSKVTLECRAGYSMVGSSVQTCDINGKWSPGLPECKLEDGDGEDGNKNDSNIGKSVGIAFAVIVVIAVIILLVIYVKKRSQQHKEAPKAGEDVALS